jgi:hypothetical protein
MLKMSEQTMNTDEEICACFIDWQKASDHVKWTKLMQILNKSGTDWHERKLIGKLYMDRSIKVQLEDVLLFLTDSIQLVERVPYQGSSCSVWRLQNRTNKHTVKYAHGHVLLAKVEMVLQGMTDRLTEIGGIK